uniref:Uncharacterized protein n=1 Tax=Anguilla anguilla TaxID=7936 RepID=A0A0E9XXD4_ANGAN
MLSVFGLSLNAVFLSTTVYACFFFVKANLLIS